jgi:hypothetical protein
MNFGQALGALKEGKKVKRGFWGGYWFIEEVEHWGDNTFIPYEPPTYITKIIMAKLKDNAGYAPAQAYQADLLAEDWEVVE